MTKDLTPLKKSVCELVTAGHIWPTQIYGDEHADWDHDAEAERQIVKVAVESNLVDVEKVLEGVLSFDIDLLRYSLELATDIQTGAIRSYPLINLGQEASEKVRAAIFEDFRTGELGIDSKFMAQALALSPKWDALYAEFERTENVDEEINADRELEQNKGARAA
jgi:hypothetical protein